MPHNSQSHQRTLGFMSTPHRRQPSPHPHGSTDHIADASTSHAPRERHPISADIPDNDSVYASSYTRPPTPTPASYRGLRSATTPRPDKHHPQRTHQAGHPSHTSASPPSLTSSPSSTSRPGRRLCSRHTSQSHVSTHSPAHARSLCTGSAARRSTTTGAEGTTTSACFAGSGAGATTRTISGTTPSYHRSGRAGAGTKTGSNAIRATTSTRIPCCATARSYPVNSPTNNPPARIPGADTAAINTTGRLRT